MNINTTPLEPDTRILIDRSLENLGWKLTGKDKNVFFEQPKAETDRKKLGGKRPDYVLYSGEQPLIVIEAKRAGARIDAALEQGIEYARVLEAPLVFATDGVFCKAFHTGANRPPILNGDEVDEFIREALALRYLSTYEVNTISSKVQYDRRELIHIFDEANNMLRGDGLRAGIERFGEFANILFLKLISESEQIKQESGIHSDFDISACSWDSIKKIPVSARIDYINSTVYTRLNKLYGTEIFTPLTIRDETILRDIMDKLDPLMLTDVDSDVKGDAFEYFLKASASTKNDLGEYFTPRHIVKTMVRLVNPQIGEKIYDPFCGTGGFLIESFRYIQRSIPSGAAKLQKILREETIYGNEITNTARITKMNMILAGDGHSNIRMIDSLAAPIDDQFDIVLANMPYSQRTKHGRLYELPSANGDSICVQHCIRAISRTATNGRMALVVPEGFLFRKDLSKTREYVLERCQLQSIISLPQGVFLPYTGVKTDIIYATKVNQKVKPSEKRRDFWYFDVKSDGYSLDNHRRKLDGPSDLTKFEEYRKLDKDQIDDMLKVGFEVISLDKVRRNSNILVGSRYRNIVVERSSYPMISLGDEKYFEILSGGTPNSTVSEYWNGAINWITLADLPADNFITEIKQTERTITQLGLDNSNAKLLPVNTIVVSTRATIGRIGIARTELATNQGFKNIIIKRSDKILPEYLAYMLTAKVEEMISLSSGATFKELSKENFCTLSVPLIPIEQQRRIVSELDGYRRVIAGAQEVIGNYKPIFSIDSSWPIKTLGDICAFEYGYTATASSKGDTRYIRITDINRDGSLSNEDSKFVDLTEENKKYLLNTGDILVTRIGATYGKTLYFEGGFNAIFASYLIRLKLDNCVLPKYFFYFTQSDFYWKQANTLATGGGQPQFNANAIKLLNIPVPSLDEQQRIISEIESEKVLVEPSKALISVFMEKIKRKIKETWGGYV